VAVIAIIALADQGYLGVWIWRGQEIIPHFDKLGHFFLMGVLALLVNLNLRCRRLKLPYMNVLLGSVIVFTLALVEELSQLIILYRTFDWADLLANSLGILVFGQIAWHWQKYRTSRQSLAP
jgi:VanZ family protein